MGLLFRSRPGGKRKASSSEPAAGERRGQTLAQGTEGLLVTLSRGRCHGLEAEEGSFVSRLPAPTHRSWGAGRALAWRPGRGCSRSCRSGTASDTPLPPGPCTACGRSCRSLQEARKPGLVIASRKRKRDWDASSCGAAFLPAGFPPPLSRWENVLSGERSVAGRLKIEAGVPVPSGANFPFSNGQRLQLSCSAFFVRECKLPAGFLRCACPIPLRGTLICGVGGSVAGVWWVSLRTWQWCARSMQLALRGRSKLHCIMVAVGQLPKAWLLSERLSPSSRFFGCLHSPLWPEGGVLTSTPVSLFGDSPELEQEHGEGERTAVRCFPGSYTAKTCCKSPPDLILLPLPCPAWGSPA